MLKSYFLKHKLTQRGFTLIELLITLAILGVVAGLAIPTYSRTVEQGRENEAEVNLRAIYNGERIFALNNGGVFFVPGANPAVNGAGSINTRLNIDIAPQFFDITNIGVGTSGTNTTFTAQAARNATSGGVVGSAPHSINETGAYV